MGKYTGKVLGLVITLAVSLLFLPILQDSIDALIGTGMVYENTAVGSLLTILPIVVVAGIVFFAIPAGKSE